MGTSLALGALLLALLTGSPAHAQVTGVEAELMQADRDFFAATRDRGLDGWMSFYTEDAVRLRWFDPAVRGLADIRAWDARLFEDPQVILAWEPVEAGVYRDGEHGWTRGRSELRRRADGVALPGTQGSYLTLWRREPDGRWKVIMDTGVSAPPPASPAPGG